MLCTVQMDQMKEIVVKIIFLFASLASKLKITFKWIKQIFIRFIVTKYWHRSFLFSWWIVNNIVTWCLSVFFLFYEICVNTTSSIVRAVNVSWWVLHAMDYGIVLMVQMSQAFVKNQQMGRLVRKQKGNMIGSQNRDQSVQLSWKHVFFFFSTCISENTPSICHFHAILTPFW